MNRKNLRYGLGVLVLFLSLAVLSGGIFLSSFTARPVLVVGDSQHNFEVQSRLVQKMVKENPAVVFSTGDQVDDGNDSGLWITYNRITAPLRAKAKIYPALGNHEHDSPLYFKNFGLKPGERWYTVKTHGIRFITLDSNTPLQAGSEQYRWLENTLKKNMSKDDFTIVIFHHPIFTTSSKHTEDEKHLRGALLPLFEKYHVDIVFSGHCHNYERSLYNGIYFIVSGGGGSRIYARQHTSPYSQVFVPNYHYCRLENKKGVLDMKVFDINGALIDKLTITSKHRHNEEEAP